MTIVFKFLFALKLVFSFCFAIIISKLKNKFLSQTNEKNIPMNSQSINPFPSNTG